MDLLPIFRRSAFVVLLFVRLFSRQLQSFTVFEQVIFGGSLLDFQQFQILQSHALFHLPGHFLLLEVLLLGIIH